MRNFSILFFVLLLVSQSLFSQETQNKISGIVTDLGSPLSNVNIKIKGTEIGENTDAKGKYSINASPRDILVFSYVGMQTVEIVVEDVTQTLNIEMTPSVEQLDEVVVERKKKSQINLREEYATNKNIIKTSTGYIDKERTGYSLKIVDGADLNPGAMDILAALQGRFPELTIRTAIDPISGTPERGVYMRGGNLSLGQARPAVFEVDGSLFPSAPLFLPISSIDRMAIISGQSSLARYGNVAAGGLIIINTKEGSRQYAMQKDSGPKIKSNEAYVSGSKFKKEPPAYLLELQNSASKSEALEVYSIQKSKYSNAPYYFLDVYAYFTEKWSDTTITAVLKNEVLGAAADNPNALKALAYLQEEQGALSAATDTYIEILKARPRYAQSYRDLANIYAKTQDYSKALLFYARYEQSRRIDTITSTLNPINSIIRTESNILVQRHGEALNASVPVTSKQELGQTRLLFEWNSSEAEFVLQFVKPDFSFLTWNHSIEANPERITDEKLEGYSSEQFLLDKDVTGTWFVNLRYYGNKGFHPSYLKTTIYYNYGLPEQTETVQVFKLDEKNVNREILSFTNNPVR